MQEGPHLSRRSGLQLVAFWLLAAFVASIPAENGITLPGGLGSLSRLLGVLAFLVAALSLFREGRLHVRPPSLFTIFALAFVLWNAATYYWSQAPSATFSNLITLTQLFVLAWLVWELCRSDDDSATLMQAFVLGCYVTIGVALLIFLQSSDPGFRNVGNFNPNTFAIVCALAIPMSWLLTQRGRSGTLGFLNAIYPALALVAIVLSASRGGFLAGLVALTVIVLGFSRLSLLRRLLLFTLVAGGAWAAFVYAPEAFPELERNVERLLTTSDELAGGTLTGRTDIWSAGARLFAQNPVAGIGSGAFAQTAEPLLGQYKDAHNAYLAVVTETGLVGLLLYLCMLTAALLSVLHLAGSRRIAMFVLLSALLVGMFPSNAENDKFAWFVLALLAVQRPLVLGAGSSLSGAAGGARSGVPGAMGPRGAGAGALVPEGEAGVGGTGGPLSTPPGGRRL